VDLNRRPSKRAEFDNFMRCKQFLTGRPDLIPADVVDEKCKVIRLVSFRVVWVGRCSRLVHFLSEPRKQQPELIIYNMASKYETFTTLKAIYRYYFFHLSMFY